MAALSSDRNTPFRSGSDGAYPQAANTTIYVGAMVGINAAGYAVPMSLAAGLKPVGIAKFQSVNAGANGAVQVQTEFGVFRVGNPTSITLASKDAPVYALDDNTVTLTSAGASSVGTVFDVDSQGVWVKFS